jgi:hypothetical protein
MTAENKKILIYTTGALVVGAVAFFVYEFFKKPRTLAIGETEIQIGEEEKKPNPFTQLTQTNFKDLDLQLSTPQQLFGLK